MFKSLRQCLCLIDITEELMIECLPLSRLINYLLSEWSDCNVEIIKIFDIFGSLYWFIYTLHEYLVSLLNKTIAKIQLQQQQQQQNDSNNNNNNNNNLDVINNEDPFKLAQSILDTL